MSRPRVRLRPGLRVSVRDGATLQVGLHPGHRAVLPDLPHVRSLLTLLAHGVDVDRLAHDQREPLRRLSREGLLLDADDEVARSRARERGRVEVVANPSVQPAVTRLLAEAGATVSREGRASVALIVATGAETAPGRHRPAGPGRPGPPAGQRGGRPAPGRSLCRARTHRLPALRRRAPHRPRPTASPRGRAAPRGRSRRPSPSRWISTSGSRGPCGTWSPSSRATGRPPGRPPSTSTPTGPVTQRWRRHPRCGCAWGDVLAG